MPSPHEFEIRPGPHAGRARRGDRAEHRRLGLEPGEHPRRSGPRGRRPPAARRSGARTRRRRARRSPARAAAPSASESPRNSSRTASGARPSPSQNAANAGQMLVVRTPPKSTTRAIGFPAMAEQAIQVPDGIDAAGVERWFADNVDGVEPPLRYERVSGGRSNLTYSVADAAGDRWALRRPPLGKRLASAHDMGREYRIISALQETPVPVPPAVGPERGGRGPVLRHGLGRGADPAHPRRGRGLPRAGRPAGDRRARRRHAGRDPRRRPRRGRASATWRARRTTSPASCAAGTASAKSSTPASCR